MKIILKIFTVENFELFIFDSYGAQIHTEAKSIIVSGTYKVWLKNSFLDRNLLYNPFWGH